jgi:hypothetical protein
MNVIKTRLQATTPVPSSPMPMLNSVSEHPINKANVFKPKATQVFLNILKTEGAKPLFAGLGLSLALTVSRQLYFYMYENLRGILVAANDEHQIIKDSAVFTPLKDSIAAFVATALYQIISNPLDIIVQRLMTHNRAIDKVDKLPHNGPGGASGTAGVDGIIEKTLNLKQNLTNSEDQIKLQTDYLKKEAANAIQPPQNKHIADAFDPFAVPEAPRPARPLLRSLVEHIDAVRLTRNLWYADPAVFYRGFVSSTILWSVNSCIWWGSFELLLQRMTNFFPKSTYDNSQQIHTFDQFLSPEVQQLLHTHPWFAQHCAAGISSWLSVVLTHPLDTARTKLMVLCRKDDGMTARGALVRTIREEGWRGLWCGLGARTLLVVPTSILTMGVYQMSKVFSVERKLRHSEGEMAIEKKKINQNEVKMVNYRKSADSEGIYQRVRLDNQQYALQQALNQLGGNNNHNNNNHNNNNNNMYQYAQNSSPQLLTPGPSLSQSQYDQNTQSNRLAQQITQPITQNTQITNQNESLGLFQRISNYLFGTTTTHPPTHNIEEKTHVEKLIEKKFAKQQQNENQQQNLPHFNPKNNNFRVNFSTLIDQISSQTNSPRLPNHFIYQSSPYYPVNIGYGSQPQQLVQNKHHNHPTQLPQHNSPNTSRHDTHTPSHQHSHSGDHHYARPQHHNHHNHHKHRNFEEYIDDIQHHRFNNDTGDHSVNINRTGPRFPPQNIDEMSKEEITNLLIQVGQVVERLEGCGYDVVLKLARNNEENDGNEQGQLYQNQKNDFFRGSSGNYNDIDDYCEECNNESGI